MIKNNKGAILVVTIVSMMILTIIGYITLQMVSNQNVMDVYDQTKIRVDYAAEGIVERARGYIKYIKDVHYVNDSLAMVTGDIGAGRGIVASAVDSSVDQKWFLFELPEDVNPVQAGDTIDNTMHPPILAGDIYCEHVDGLHEGINCPNTEITAADGTQVITRSYRIVATAHAMVDAAGGSEITSTVSYYFMTEHIITKGISPSGGETENHETNFHLLGWRKS